MFYESRCNMAKYVFVTGGVVSGLGKGITASSLALLLKSRGYKVFMQNNACEDISRYLGKYLLHEAACRLFKPRAKCVHSEHEHCKSAYRDKNVEESCHFLTPFLSL